jgi:uridine nucleosidase
VRALDGMSKSIKKAMAEGHKVTVVSCGPCTNIALFVSIYPDLLVGIQQFVFMGGGVGLGNRSAVAGGDIFASGDSISLICGIQNTTSCVTVGSAWYKHSASLTLVPAEAAQILLDVPVKKIMMPINVTHTAIATSAVQARLLSSGGASTGRVRHTLSTLINFFAETYRTTFGFVDGPPLHDPLTIAFISRPDLFSCQRYHVDVELNGKHTSGETVVDVWGYRHCDESWGALGKNCLVAQSVDVIVPQVHHIIRSFDLFLCNQVDGFFDLFLDCVARCDKLSPLNN